MEKVCEAVFSNCDSVVEKACEAVFSDYDSTVTHRDSQ